MRAGAAIAGAGILLLVLVDAFNTIVLARRTEHVFRITRLYYRLTWKPCSAIGRRIKSSENREAYLGIFGPLSLLVLFAIWAVALIVAFALMQWAVRMQPASYPPTLTNYLYLSASTLITLSAGDPLNTASKFISVAEGGLGFAFLGLVIGYLPVFYQSFSTRESPISLLDARGGSPPSAGALLQFVSGEHPLKQQLAAWEGWTAQVLENHLSFPMLAYFRSQHANQSWLTALVAIVDLSAVVDLTSRGDLQQQAKFTLAMGIHVLADMAVVFGLEKQSQAAQASGDQRQSHGEIAELQRILRASPDVFNPDLLTGASLNDSRKLYEGQAFALSGYLLMALPSWIPDDSRQVNWRVPLANRGEVRFAVSDPFAQERDDQPQKS